MKLVPFVRAHLEAVLAVEEEVFAGKDPWSRMAFEGELINPQAVWLVADVDGGLAGYAGGWAGGADFHLLNLAVAPAFRRRGIARELVRGVLGRATERGCRRATLEVRKGNDHARRLYESLGFAAAGCRPRHYSDGEDAVIYWLERIAG